MRRPHNNVQVEQEQCSSVALEILESTGRVTTGAQSLPARLMEKIVEMTEVPMARKFHSPGIGQRSLQHPNDDASILFWMGHRELEM